MNFENKIKKLKKLNLKTNFLINPILPFILQVTCASGIVGVVPAVMVAAARVAIVHQGSDFRMMARRVKVRDQFNFNLLEFHLHLSYFWK